MPVAKINDHNLYYQIDGDGDWLIFVHGGGGTHLSWWRQVYTFRERYKCLSYDSRGCGQSDGIEDATVGDADLLALMDHLGIERAYLNGHSAGGTAVSKVAQAHPDRALALVMTDTVFGFQTAALNRWAGEMLDKFEKGFDIRNASVADTFARNDPEGYFLNRTLARLNAGQRPRDPAEYRVRFGEAYRRMRDTPPVDYSKFPVPTLFTVGEVDGLTLPWLVRDTAKAVGGARLAEFPRSGHGPPQEQTEAYNAVLQDFLDSVERRRRDPSAVPPPWSLVEYFDALSGRHR
jgi:pimeloyl-ACP methyl ester carboxylesterase